MMTKVLLHASQEWPMTNSSQQKRLFLAKITNTYFYYDSRPQLRIIKVANIQKTGHCLRIGY